MHTTTRLTGTLFVVSALGVLFGQGCGHSSDSSPTCSDGIKNGNETGIDCGGTCRPCGLSISGHFASAATSSSLSCLKEGAASAQALDASTVSMVLVFDTGGKSSSAPVTNGSFSIPVNSTAPIGMIFVGASDNFLGYLTLGNGIDSLPMTAVADGVTAIDLQTLSASGSIVTPGYNPLGTELPLSSADQTAYAQCNGFFASIVQNPDVDGDGVIDVLQNHFYSTQVVYYTNPMFFNGALTPTISGNVAVQSSRVGLLSWDNSDDGATVTGPPGSGITNLTCAVWNTGTMTYWDVADVNGGITPTTVPVSGEYVFMTVKGKTLPITVPDQSNINSNIVVAVPTVTVSNGNISQISWIYEMPESAVALSPCAIIRGIMVQISSGGIQVTNPAPAPCTTTSVDVSTLNIPWDDSAGITMAYNDVFGNQYVMGFSNSH